MIATAEVPLLLACGWLAVAAGVDALTGRIPNRLVGGACAMTLLASGLPATWAAASAALAAALVAALPYAAAYGGGLVGGGDVKLAVPAGGLLADPVIALGAVVLASVVSGVACALAGERSLPHGPALVGAVLGMLVFGAGPAP